MSKQDSFAPSREDSHRINLRVEEDTVITVNDTIVLEYITSAGDDGPVIVVHQRSGEEFVIQDFSNIFVRNRVGQLVPYTGRTAEPAV